jgi:hypothetical protein
MSYVTVADLQNYTKLKTDDANELQIYIDSALDVVHNYLGYNPEIDFHTEVIQGNGNNKIKLKHKPINLVYKISDYESDNVLFEAKQSLTQDYIITEEFVTFKNIIFPKSKLIIEYVSGYGLLDFSPSTIDGGSAQTLDFEKEINGGDAVGYEEGGIYNHIDGGSAITIGVIENNMPPIFKQTVLRIAALLLTEANNNIGVTSLSFGDTGNRSFLNYTNYDKYLSPLNKYKLIVV